jgi:hypothetical protein
VAVLREGRIESRLQDLQEGLLDEAVERRWDAELSLPTVALWNELTLDRLGLYVPASSSSRSSGQVTRRWLRSASTVIPSVPGLPLFFCTRFNAITTLPRSTTRSISFASPVPERSSPCVAVDASPLPPTFGASPLFSSGSSSCPDFWRLTSARSTVDSLSSPFGPSRRQRLPR